MKSNVPWSVKGIDPEARVVAKEAARKAGMTLGEWMTSMIQDVGNESNAASEHDNAQARTGVTTDQLRSVVDSLNRLNERLKTTEDHVKLTEEQSRQAASGLNHGLETIFERLKRVEREKAEGAPTELIDRVQRLESTEGGKQTVEGLKALEQALGQMLEQFESTRQDALVRVEQNERAVAALGGRVDVLDTRISAGFQEVHDALDTITSHLDHTERTAKAVMLEASDAATSPDAEFVERTGRKLQLLGNEIKRSGDQIAAVEQMVSALSQKIEDAEHRSAEGISAIADELTALRVDVEPAVDHLSVGAEPSLVTAAADAEEAVAALQRSYDQVIARLEGGETPAPSLQDTSGQDDTPNDRATPAIQTLAATGHAAPQTTSAPVAQGSDETEREFDAIFETPSTPEPATPTVSAPEASALMSTSDVSDDHKAMTPREKILAAAQARKARLEQEDDEDSRDALLAAAATQRAADDPFVAEPSDSQQTDTDETVGAYEEPGQNSKLGMPLLMLLGILLLAVFAAGYLFFGTGDDAGDQVASETAADVQSVEQTSSSVIPDELTNPATPRATGAELYAQARQTMASTRTPQGAMDAFDLMRRSAIAGHVPAQYQLGQMYHDAYGTEQNLLNARRWFTEAAQSGNANAMHRLGGLAIANRNYDNALEWYARAADYGVVDSMYNLGYLYDPNTPDDLLPETMRVAALSYYWYALAARQGDTPAATDAAGVASYLTADQITEIDAEVANWTPAPYDAAVNDGIGLNN